MSGSANVAWLRARPHRRSALGGAGRIALLVLPPLAFLVIVLAIWEAIVRFEHVQAWLLPAPSDVARQFLNTPQLGYFTLYTIKETIFGFLIATACGIILAAVLVQAKILERSIFPYVVLFNAIPIVAIIPLLTIWLGFGIQPKIAVAAIIAFFPIVTNTLRGLKATDRNVVEFMRSIDSSRWDIFRRVQLPSALPYLFAAFKISSALSLVGAVVAEFYNSDRGLGYLVVKSANELQTAQLFVAIAVLAAFGLLMLVVIQQLEHVIVRWERETDTE